MFDSPVSTPAVPQTHVRDVDIKLLPKLVVCEWRRWQVQALAVLLDLGCVCHAIVSTLTPSLASWDLAALPSAVTSTFPLLMSNFCTSWHFAFHATPMSFAISARLSWACASGAFAPRPPTMSGKLTQSVINDTSDTQLLKLTECIILLFDSSDDTLQHYIFVNPHASCIDWMLEHGKCILHRYRFSTAVSLWPFVLLWSCSSEIQRSLCRLLNLLPPWWPWFVLPSWLLHSCPNLPNPSRA